MTYCEPEITNITKAIEATRGIMKNWIYMDGADPRLPHATVSAYEADE